MSCRLSPIIAFTAVLALTACHPAPIYYLVEGEPKPLVVTQPPPAPRIEEPSPAPSAEHVWRDGFWAWNGDGATYGWTPGEWVLPPNTAYVYVPPTYGLIDGSWNYRPGFWCHRRHRDRFWRRHRGTWQSAGAHRPGAHRPGRHVTIYPNHGPSVAGAGRVRAPAVGGAEKVHAKAPPASGKAPGIEQDRSASSVTHPSAVKSAGGWQAMQRPRRTVVLDRTSSPTARAIDIHAGSRRPLAPSLRRDPSYRGTRAGRPTFGDDPSGRGRPSGRYRRDATGAIVLANPGTGAGARGLRRSRSYDRINPNVRAAHDPRFVRGPRAGGPVARTNGWRRTPRPQPRSYYPTRRVQRGPSYGPRSTNGYRGAYRRSAPRYSTRPMPRATHYGSRTRHSVTPQRRNSTGHTAVRRSSGRSARSSGSRGSRSSGGSRGGGGRRR